MAIAYFCKNTSFYFDNREYQLNQEITKGNWQAKEIRTGRIQEFSMTELQQHYAEGKLVFLEDAEKANKVEKAFNEKPKKISHQTESAEWEKPKSDACLLKQLNISPALRD